MSRALSLAYDEPLQIVRGEGAYLYDDRPAVASSTWSTTSRTSATATRAWSRRARGRWRC